MQVFLSYSRRDSTFVRRLAESLEGRDVDAWLDTDELAATDEDRWRRSIVQGIRESAALVVVLSPDSVSSGQVERELTIAAETKRRIIPIIFRPCDLPDGFQFELAGVQRIDFSEQPYESALDQLVRRIGVLPPPENVTPVLPLAPPSETAARAAQGAAPRLAAPTSTPMLDPPRSPTQTGNGRARPLVAAGLLLLVGIVVAVVASGASNDGDDNASATSTVAATSTVPTTIEDEDDDQEGHPAPTASTQEAETRAVAAEVIGQFIQAYDERDWERVRRLDPTQAELTDAFFETHFGRADSMPRMERAFYRVISYESSGSGTALVRGAQSSWNFDADGHMWTDLGCVTWTVNTRDRTISVKAVADSTGGTESLELDDWLTFDELDPDHCG